MALSRRAQLESRIAQAKQGVESASIMRSYSEIVAPFSGIVTEKIANPGQLATPGAPLLTIEASGGFRLEAPVEESMLGSIRLGQTAPVLLDASDQTLSARITEIVPAVDPASRSFIVKASLPASNHVRSGVFGRLRLPRGTRESIAVPGDAVSHRGEIQSVFVVENGVARTRMITTGEERDSKVEVLSGLQPGEKIVYPLPAGLADGSKVEARP
jgi:RND family efflux transporter MFP subunit